MIKTVAAGWMALMFLATLVVGSCVGRDAVVAPSLRVADSSVAITVAQLDALIREAQDSFGVPGLAVGVIYKGEVVLSQGYGFRQNETTDAVDGQTLFAIASNTKAFVGTAAAMLAEQDEDFSLDDRATKYLPYLRYADDNVTALVNVTDLMSHRIGLGTFMGDHLWFKRLVTPEQVLTQVPSLPLEYPFRAGYGYSNLGFIAAGEVIKQVASKSWADVVSQQIFSPLGMTRSVTATSQLEGAGNYAVGHVSRQQNAAIPAVAWDTPGAAGGIWSCTDDMLRWMACNLNEGMYQQDTIWSSAVQREVWTPHNTFGNSSNFVSYGLGWVMGKAGSHTVYRHGGGYDGMYSQVQLEPEAELGIVVLTNSMTRLPGALCKKIRQLYLGEGDSTWLGSEMGRQREGDSTWFAQQDSVAYYLDNETTGYSDVLPLRAGTYVDASFGTFTVTDSAGVLHLAFPESALLGARLQAVQNGLYAIKWDERNAWFDKGFVYVEPSPQGETLRLFIPNDDIFYDGVRAVRQ